MTILHYIPNIFMSYGLLLKHNRSRYVILEAFDHKAVIINWKVHLEELN